MAREDLLRRLAEVQEGIEAATVMQDFRSIGQLARERDRLQRELAEDETEAPMTLETASPPWRVNSVKSVTSRQTATKPSALYTLAS